MSWFLSINNELFNTRNTKECFHPYKYSILSFIEFLKLNVMQYFSSIFTVSLCPPNVKILNGKNKTKEFLVLKHAIGSNRSVSSSRATMNRIDETCWEK